jgi:hypothetical protein
LYTYPTDGTWDQIIQVKNAHPSVPIIAVINPSNGPGPSLDSNYVTGIQKMQAAGVVVLGYVHTGFGYGGLRSPGVLETEINNYKTWYNPNGIFFDEMANIAGDENYYTVLNTYTKSLGFTYTMGNPGTETLPSYIGTVDNIVIYESGGLPAISDLASWHTQYSKSNFSYVAIGVGSLNTAFEIQSSQYVSYIYITNDGGGNPYDTLPSYFGNEVAMLDTGSTTTVPMAPTSLTSTAASSSQINLISTAASSSQINLSWAASNDGGSAITGYKIERSTDGGSTWSAIVSSTGSTSTTYSDSGLIPNTPYTYRVSAINLVGASSTSNTTSATTNAATFILTVNSQDSSGNVTTGYYAGLAANNGTRIAAGFTPYNFTLINTQNYFIHVENYGKYVFSYWLDTGSTNANRTISISSNNSITAVYKTVPAHPTGLTATAVSSSKINLSWIAPSNNGGSPIIYYNIERSTNGGTTWSTILSNIGNTTTYFNTGLGANTTYNYRVSAVNAIGTSSPSNIAYAKTSALVSLTIESVDLLGKPINGLWTTLISGGLTIKTGYTPLTYTVNAGNQYTVTVANYQNYVFNHWSDGSANSSKIITPTQNTTLTAYYPQGN